MKRIPLTQGQFALVDDEDFEKVNAFNWYAHYSKRTKSYYATRKKYRKHIYMHRFIMNTPDDLLCDHINHNTLDNQKDNLRNCTNIQNAWNSKLFSTNTTGFKGISKSKVGYLANLTANGQSVLSKNFKTLEEAIVAYEEAVIKYHGEYRYKKEKAQE